VPSYTRQKCPAHSDPAPAEAAHTKCVCGLRASARAARAAIALRPIPDLAVRTGAAVAAAIALRDAGVEEQARTLLASVERTVAEANGGLLFGLLGMRPPRQGNERFGHAPIYPGVLTTMHRLEWPGTPNSLS